MNHNLREQLTRCFQAVDKEEIAEHAFVVADIAVELARAFKTDEQQAELAGLLHDIGRTVTDSDMIQRCIDLSIEVLPEERQHPGILHQKLAPVLAKEAFGITDEVVLDAIECHTTLKANASQLAKVVFLADKLSWAENDTSFHASVRLALNDGLDSAVCVYIEWLLSGNPPVVHPWLREAYKACANSGANCRKE